MSKTKLTISLLEVILGLLQPLLPFLDLQVDLRIFKIISYTQNIGFDTIIKSLACLEPKLQFHSLKLSTIQMLF